MEKELKVADLDKDKWFGRLTDIVDRTAPLLDVLTSRGQMNGGNYKSGSCLGDLLLGFDLVTKIGRAHVFDVFFFHYRSELYCARPPPEPPPQRL